MRVSLCLICPTLLFVLGSSIKVHTKVEVFVNGILDIRKFYSAATVIFAHPGDTYGEYGDLQITYFVHTCSIILSRNYVVTLDIHFKKLRNLLRYHHRIVKPLAVVILPDFKGYLEFAKATETFFMSFPVWFVMFLYKPANNTHDHCHHPIGNPFNLSFNSQMLVLCYEDDILREWYSVKGETTKIYDLARWTSDHRFVPLSKLGLYDRRKDLEGVILRAVRVKNAPILKYNGNKVTGLYGKILDEITRSLNFTLDTVREINDHGIWLRKNNSWSGAMNEIVSGRADFAIADMSMTSLRRHYVDFTLPLIISTNNLFFKESGICGVKWLGYFQTFDLFAWIAILTLIAVTPLLLCFMRTCNDSRNIAFSISDSFICLWGIFCQQALTEFPRPSSLRIAYFTMFCTAILVTAYYSAELVCFLTACVRVLPFRTFNEFVDHSTYKLIVPRGSSDYDTIATSNESYSLKLMKLMKEESELPSSVTEGFVQICNDKKLAYLVLDALKKTVEMQIPCKLSRISTQRIDNLGMILSKDNPYTDVINNHLQKFLDNGMMMRLRYQRFSTQSAKKAYEPVRVANVIPILAILCGGIILSIFILIIEKTYFLCKIGKAKRKRHPLRTSHRREKLQFAIMN